MPDKPVERARDASEIDNSQWKAEAEFFDREAHTREITPLNPEIIRRYANPKLPWAIDFQFRAAGDLRGKRVLDVGAGTGENSLVLAALGAKVTAIDISPGSLAVLRQRAELSGLSDAIETVCSPLEAWDPGEDFDIVWVSAFLHHVLSNLEFVLGHLKRFAGSHGRVIIAEPYSPRWLRRLRLALPIEAGGTPGERPLNVDELRLLGTYFPGIQKRHFFFLSRLIRFTPKAEMFAGFDSVFLQLPLFKELGGVVVLWT